jgi:alkaline phosphatase
VNRRILIALTLIFCSSPTIVAAKPKKPKAPKHIVLIIGDGTGLAQWSAYNAKRTQGINDMDSAAVVFTDFPIIGFSLTSSANDFITDSGAGATALSTGKKSCSSTSSVSNWLKLKADSACATEIHTLNTQPISIHLLICLMFKSLILYL